MDPDKLLRDMLENARAITDINDELAADADKEHSRMSPSDYQHKLGEANDHAEALAQQLVWMHDWLSKGGFLPKPWNRKIG